MKKILICTLLMFLNLISFSQSGNGGQHFENNAIRLRYFGYNSGSHNFMVVNKQNCEASIRTRIDEESSVMMVAQPNDSFYINVPRSTPTNVKLRAKTETSCFQGTNNGWVELNTSGFALPLVEDNIIRIVRGPNEYKVQLVGYVLKSDFGLLSEKQTVVIHNMVGTQLHFRRIFVNKRNEVDLYPFMVNGLNLVTIFIDNKSKDIFTFRVFKY